MCQCSLEAGLVFLWSDFRCPCSSHSFLGTSQRKRGETQHPLSRTFLKGSHVWEAMGCRGHKHKEAKCWDSRRQEASLCHHLWGFQEGESQTVFTLGEGDECPLFHSYPSWMLLSNTTHKAQMVPLPQEVNKGSWDKTSGYSGWRNFLFLASPSC